MGKRIVLVLFLICTLATPVYGHLAGAFADFLTIVHDESTIDQLKDEMAETKRQIEQLQPEVDAHAERFSIDHDLAEEQMRAYADTGLDVWLAMIQSGKDAADLLGVKWQLERGIALYLEDLNELYLDFQQLKIEQETLKDHEQLLTVIGKNLDARQLYLEENAGLSLEVVANYLDIDWTSEVEYGLIDELAADQERISQGVADWLASSQPDTLDEDWLNETSRLRYFFREDHLYVAYEIETAHVILLGQFLENREGDGAELVFEAGFYNGFYLPEELLEELRGFRLDYEAIRQETGWADLYFYQNDGALKIQEIDK